VRLASESFGPVDFLAFWRLAFSFFGDGALSVHPKWPSPLECIPRSRE